MKRVQQHHQRLFVPSNRFQVQSRKTAPVFSRVFDPGPGESGQSESNATSSSINRSGLLHAVMGLRRRHICRLGEKIFMELRHKPAREDGGVREEGGERFETMVNSNGAAEKEIQ